MRIALTTLLFYTLLTGCGGEPAAPAAASNPALPAGLFATAPAPVAKDVEDVKKTAKAGDDVVLQAQIGGRKRWHVEGKAIFVVVDPVLESCNEMEDDPCTTPWDFCCVPKEQITAKLATIRVVGADGEPIAGSIEGVHGLEPLAHVVIAGKVRDNADGNLVVDARQIWVK